MYSGASGIYFQSYGIYFGRTCNRKPSSWYAKLITFVYCSYNLSAWGFPILLYLKPSWPLILPTTLACMCCLLPVAVLSLGV